MNQFQFIFDLKDKMSEPIKKIKSITDGLESSLGDVNRAASELRKPLEKIKISNDLTGGVKQLDKSMRKLRRLMIGGGIGYEIASWGRNMLDTVVSFEKFEGQLEQSFGAVGVARDYLNEIGGYASKATIPIDDMVGAFVDMAKNGERLSTSQMRSLGDFAVFASKDIGDLSEALSSVSDTKKWGKLGIDVLDVGGKLKASFNGATIEVEKSRKGVLDMIKSFGDLNNVQGLSTKESNKVGGALAELQNNFKVLQVEMGEKLKPIILGVIGGFSSIIDKIRSATSFFQENQKAISAIAMPLLRLTGYITGVLLAYKTLKGVKNIMSSIKMATIDLYNSSFITKTMILAKKLAFVALNGVMLAFNGVLVMVRGTMALFNAVLMANPLGLVVAAISAVSVGLFGLSDMFPKIGAYIRGFYNTVVDWFGKAYDWVNDRFIKPIFDKFKALTEFLGFASDIKVDPIKSGAFDEVIKVNQSLKNLSMPKKSLIGGFNGFSNEKSKDKAVKPLVSNKIKGLSSVIGQSKEGKVVNIKIDSLVKGGMNFHYATDRSMNPSDLEEQITKLLLKTVNNVNQAQ